MIKLPVNRVVGGCSLPDQATTTMLLYIYERVLQQGCTAKMARILLTLPGAYKTRKTLLNYAFNCCISSLAGD